MRRASIFCTSAQVCTLLLGLPSCEHHSSDEGPPPASLGAKPPPSSGQTAGPPKQPTPAPTHSTDEPKDPSESLAVSELPEEAPPASSGKAGGATPSGKLLIDDALVIGAAGAMTADGNSVVMIDRNDQIHVSKRLSLSASSNADLAHFSGVPGSVNAYNAVARGPMLLRGKAYWVSDGKLVRRAIDNSTPLEILARDARNGTRVAGSDVPGAPAHAIYVTKPVTDDAPPHAKLWVEGGETVPLSPEGAGASSVTSASTGEDLFAVYIDARSAMTPLHGRRVRFKNDKPELAPDVVMWVGASSQTLSEVFASTTPFGVRAFIPIERDISHFGLVMLALGSEPKMDPKSVYRGYPNGIDVAPVASAAFCGSAFVAYVRPATATPDSGEVLELAEITEAGLGPAEQVAKARGISNISLGAASNSAVLAYVADWETYATTIRCKRSK